jgi:hypothetical protein
VLLPERRPNSVSPYHLILIAYLIIVCLLRLLSFCMMPGFIAQWLDGLMSLNQLHSLYLGFNMMVIFLVKFSILIPNVENG